MTEATDSTFELSQLSPIEVVEVERFYDLLVDLDIIEPPHPIATADPPTEPIQKSWVQASIEAPSAIDPAALQEIYRIGGNLPNFLVDIIDCYLQEAPKLLSAAREASAQPDRATLKRSLHTLRSSSTTVGAMTVAKLSEELEAITIAVSPAEILDRLQILDAEHDRVAIVLRQECQRFLADEENQG